MLALFHSRYISGESYDMEGGFDPVRKLTLATALDIFSL